ncbi:MAG: hypothetical protein ABMA02_16595 [Saprospiraceae bacterium]
MLQVKDVAAHYLTSKSWIDDMGRVYAEIEVTSVDDLVMAKKGFLEQSKVRNTIVHFVVDSGADYLCINEHIKNQLDLTVQEERSFELADGTEMIFKIAGPVRIRFANRQTICNAVVRPGGADPLLGAIPMEDLDVVIHPRSQTLTVNPENPFMAKHFMK